MKSAASRDHPLILKTGGLERLPAPPSNAGFTLSARGKSPRTPILEFLASEFPHLSLSQIESVFGFVEPCTLYGGRPFARPELSPRDVRTLHDCCIGLRLPLSNHHVERGEYDGHGGFLERYHFRGNSVITTSDKLAGWIRQDYPRFEIEASVIKEIDTQERIHRALEIYDTVVLPMRLNLDTEFLERIEPKARITLFANAGCALTCPAKICYPSFSRANKLTGEGIACSFQTRPRELYGMLNFDLQKLATMGFTRFKLLRMRGHGLTGF